MLLYYTTIPLQDESEVDPLEAFMEGVSNEIKAENKQTNVVKKVKKIVKVGILVCYLECLILYLSNDSSLR